MEDDRDILETMRAELSCIERGGDGRSVRAPLVPASPFQGSLTRPDFGYPYRAHPGAECLLNDFVRQPQLEEKLKAWLRARHTETEIERAEAGTRIYRHDGRP